MNTLKDVILLRTPFGRMLMNKAIEKYIRQQLKKEAEVYVGDVDVVYENNNLVIDIQKVHIEMNGNNFLNLLD